MDWNAILSSLGEAGPLYIIIAGMAYYIKYQNDTNREQITNLTTVIQNNTIALTKLLERMGE